MSGTFGSKEIFPIKLRKNYSSNNYKLVPASFSSISFNDDDDWRAMDKAFYEWSSPCGQGSYIKNIVDDFETPQAYHSCYITELKDENGDLYDRMTSVMQTTNPNIKAKDEFEIFYVQSSPDILYSPFQPPVKGAGELAIYGAVRLAKENFFKLVSLLSTNDSFYYQIGFLKSKNNESDMPTTKFELPCEKYDEFLKRVEDKYSLNS